jgi:deoxyribodipyrimidine photo-lyase
VIIWFRRDLRVTDHPALHAAIGAARDAGRPVTALYVLDPRLLASTG